MNHGRGHTEREVVNGPRVQDSGLSFFSPSSIGAASLFLRISVCSSRWVPRWLHVLIFLHNRLARAREENHVTPIYIRVQCCIRIRVYYAATFPLSLLIPLYIYIYLFLSLSLFVSIYRSLAVYACTRTDIALPGRGRSRRVARGFAHWHTEHLGRALTSLVFNRKSKIVERKGGGGGIDVGIGTEAEAGMRRVSRNGGSYESSARRGIFLATRKGGTKEEGVHEGNENGSEGKEIGTRKRGIG